MWLLILFAIIIFMVIIINILYRHTSQYKNEQSQYLRLKHMEKNLDIVNIGSGPSLYAFDWENTNLQGCNMAIWPEDFRYDYRILKEYYPCLKKRDGIVIQAISPLSFANNSYIHSTNFSEKYVYILPYEEVDLPFLQYILEKYFPLINHPRRIKVFFKRAKIEELLDDTESGQEKKKKSSENFVKGWIAENPGLKNLKDVNAQEIFRDDFKRNINDLNKTYHFCLEKNIQYYAVVLPISKYLNSFFSKQFLDVFLFDNIKGTDIPEERVLNFLNDRQFGEMDLYTNGLFLNKIGRKKFTKIILNKIMIAEKRKHS